ncbi:hypothetical protein A7P53_15710 [Acinetobacter defluvii]|uniref:Uncharacterized protein n=1 Tax=Acinetobacter defluvii TaxID=1871111 RepID=A0A2S2FE09_9GAMM|nr:hypothetical protein [Acinetobacter defluvii]AWL29211.1 hypothetical protein DJ533_11860 [Acinetobacter defluvii]NNP74104.1 hypothetical protein [Acinetobacter defluvii]
MFKQSKVQIESLRAMDSRVMQKQGIFKNGTGSYYWRDAKTNETRANIDYRYQDQQLTLSYHCNGESYCYIIRIDRTTCHYGGTRSWFICPSQKCRKRVAKLYFSESGYFTCRHCNNANYAIQQMSEKDKPRYHMHKMRDKLGWSYNHVPFIKRISKPLNMHHKTFKAMVAKHDEYERQFLVNFQAFIDKFENM